MKNSIQNATAAFSEDAGKFLLRAAVAVVIFPHGAQKALGAFGGNGLVATWSAFTEKMGIPAPLAGAAIFTEFVVPILLILGVFPRVCAALLVVLMAGAARYHLENGFFMNWSGKQPGEGVEYHLLFIGATLALALFGGGRFTLSRLFSRENDASAPDEE
ncbi:MAG: DoxX family protein [Candidatus Spyradosoma sp.]